MQAKRKKKGQSDCQLQMKGPTTLKLDQHTGIQLSHHVSDYLSRLRERKPSGAD